MAEPEVHANDSVKKDAGKPAPGKQGVFAKYKWWIVGGGIVIILLLFYFMHSAGSSSSSNTASQQAAETAAQEESDIDPATGYPYGSAADLAALGSGSSSTSVPGPAGSTGATGATGPTGQTGATGASGPGTYAAQGTLDLNKIAGEFGTNEQTLISLNPSLKNLKVEKAGKKVNLIGSGEAVPTGTVINLPSGTT
jgi:hypothetical protein